MKPMEDGNSAGDRLSMSMKWLEEHPDADLQTRACFAVVVAVGGDEERQINFGDVAEVLGAPVDEVFDALMSLMDRPA
jgi:hypothetical protein